MSRTYGRREPGPATGGPAEGPAAGSGVQDRGTAEAPVGEVRQRPRGVVHGVGDGGGADAQAARQPQELLAIAAGVGRDAAQPALLEQLGGVVQRRYAGEPDAGDGERRAAVQ